jgi:phosphoribosylformimino-5-aminoimidazole carboxamide ribotide isomerase
MQLWPAIDLLRGQAVRLARGNYDDVTVYADDPAAVAAAFRTHARHLHVVDLEGARAGRPVQRDLVRAIVSAFGPGVQIGGGVRDRAAFEAYLELGADRVVMGTAAVQDTALVREIAEAHPGRLVVALDAKDGRVATHAWESVTDRTAIDLVGEMRDLAIAAVLYTDIARDGMRVGPNVEATALLAERGGLPVLASGGVATIDDIRRLARTSAIAGAVVGRALYEKAFTLEEAVLAAGEGAQ